MGRRKARRHIRGYYVCLCPIKDSRLIWVNSNVSLLGLLVLTRKYQRDVR